MEPITARDVSAADLSSLAVFGEGYRGRIAVRTVDHHILHLVNDRGAHPVLCVVQIAGDLCLAIDHDLLADQLVEIDMHHQVVVGQVAAFVRQALLVHPRTDTGMAQQVHCTVFKHARADA